MLRKGPHIMPMELGDTTAYGRDMKILWAAFKLEFPGHDLSQEEFAQTRIERFALYDSLWMVEDRNDAFPGQRGAVGMFLVKSDGFIIQPQFKPFKWATRRNVVRSVMAFLNWVRFSRDVGLCVFPATVEAKPMLWRMRDYGILLTYVGNGLFVLPGEKTPA
jgi:hypothetical protein